MELYKGISLEKDVSFSPSAQRHRQGERQTDRQTDDIIMPVADHTVCNTNI